MNHEMLTPKILRRLVFRSVLFLDGKGFSESTCRNDVFGLSITTRTAGRAGGYRVTSCEIFAALCGVSVELMPVADQQEKDRRILSFCNEYNSVLGLGPAKVEQIGELTDDLP